MRLVRTRAMPLEDHLGHLLLQKELLLGHESLAALLYEPLEVLAQGPDPGQQHGHAAAPLHQVLQLLQLLRKPRLGRLGPLRGVRRDLLRRDPHQGKGGG
jgi:hypothetical protein